MRPPHTGYVATIDGTSAMPAERARTLARGMFIAGFCMLPWCACSACALSLPGLSRLTPLAPSSAVLQALACEHVALLAARAPRRGSHRGPHDPPLCAPAAAARQSSAAADASRSRSAAVARRSAVGAAVFVVLLLPWAMGFVFAGAQFVGDHAWEMLAVTRWAATNTQARPAAAARTPRCAPGSLTPAPTGAAAQF